MTTRTSNPLRRLPPLILDAALLPVAAPALAFAPDSRLARRVFRIAERPNPARRALHAVVGFLLGLASWILLAFVLLTFARGALYPLFDSGPYDHSWGGPTLAGAWAVHFLLSTLFQVAVLLLLGGVGALNGRLSAPYRGARTGWWPWPVAVLICASTAAFVAAWTTQI